MARDDREHDSIESTPRTAFLRAHGRDRTDRHATHGAPRLPLLHLHMLAMGTRASRMRDYFLMLASFSIEVTTSSATDGTSPLTNLTDTLLTQCRSLVGVMRSPANTWPK